MAVVIRAMDITWDITKPISERERGIIERLMVASMMNDSEAVRSMLSNRSFKSLRERGVIKIEPVP